MGLTSGCVWMTVKQNVSNENHLAYSGDLVIILFAHSSLGSLQLGLHCFDRCRHVGARRCARLWAWLDHCYSSARNTKSVSSAPSSVVRMHMVTYSLQWRRKVRRKTCTTHHWMLWVMCRTSCIYSSGTSQDGEVNCGVTWKVSEVDADIIPQSSSFSINNLPDTTSHAAPATAATK